MAEDIDKHDFRLPSEKASGQSFNAPADHDYKLPSEKAAETESLMKALRQQRASWQDDGLGIRGHAPVVSNSRAQLVWPSSQVTRRFNPELDQGEVDVEAEVPAGP